MAVPTLADAVRVSKLLNVESTVNVPLFGLPLADKSVNEKVAGTVVNGTNKVVLYGVGFDTTANTPVALLLPEQ